MIGINNVLCLLAFSLVAAGLQLTGGLVDPSDWYALYSALYPLVWQIAGSLALGLPKLVCCWPSGRNT